MIALNKSIYRITRGALDGSNGPDRGRFLVVGAEVGDVISFRPQGRTQKQTVRLSVFDAYRMALRIQANRLQRRAAEIKKANGGKMASALKQARKEAA